MDKHTYLSSGQNKEFVLIFDYCGTKTVVATGDVRLVSERKKLLQHEQAYKGGKLIIRTKEGFKKFPDWEKKVKVNYKIRK